MELPVLFFLLFGFGTIATMSIPYNTSKNNVSISRNANNISLTVADRFNISEIPITNNKTYIRRNDKDDSNNYDTDEQEVKEDNERREKLKVLSRKANKSDLINTEKQKSAGSASDNKPIVYTYRLNKGEDGKTCTLMTVDAMLTVTYTSKTGEKMEGDLFVPSNVDVDGDCSSPDESTLILRWEKYQLTIRFDKTPGGERWFIKNVQIDFSTDDTKFNHIKYPHTKINAISSEDDILFPTPVGNSFKCHREIKIDLMNPQYGDLKVGLLLRELTIQPFIFKGEDFGPEYLCTAMGTESFRSETLPFIFGSLLAASSVLTIAGYAVYRYFTINKVHYQTME